VQEESPSQRPLLERKKLWRDADSEQVHQTRPRRSGIRATPWVCSGSQTMAFDHVGEIRFLRR
jgi:hypothetical protein